jgi:hypothetical protein
VGVQKVMWDKGGTARAGDYNYSYIKGDRNQLLGTEFLVHHRFISAVKRVEYISDRVSYIILICRWCNIMVLNMHSPSEEKR